MTQTDPLHPAPIDFNIDYGYDYLHTESVSSVDVPWPLNCSIDHRGFVLDTALFELATVPVLREARDEGAEPGEQSISAAGAWKRSRVDWSLGAGQEWADDQDSDRRRFWMSRGVNPWERRFLCPLPDVEQIGTATSTAWMLLAVGPYLFVANATGLVRYDNAAEPADTINLSGETFVDMTTDGQTIWIATSTSVRSMAVDSASPPTLVTNPMGSYDATHLHYWGGWVIGASSATPNRIDRNSPSGPVDEIWTHPSSGFVWEAMAGTPFGFLAVGQTAWGAAEIYGWQISDTGIWPDAPYLAAQLPGNEQVWAMVHAYGSRMVILGTSRGVRAASIDDDGKLTFGAVIDLAQPVRCLAVDGEFVWFGWSDWDEHHGLGRLHLTEFTAELVPAYASDLMAAVAGTETVTVTRWGGKTLFALSGGGIYQEADMMVADAWLNMGHFVWGAFDPKTFLGAEVVHDPLQGTIAVEVFDDFNRLIVANTRSAQGSTGVGIDLVGPPTAGLGSDAMHVILRFVTNPEVMKVCIRRVTLRALPNLRQVSEVVLPLIVHSVVDAGVEEGQDIAYDPLEVFTWCKQLERQARSVPVQIGQFSSVGTIRSVAYQGQGTVRGWTHQRRWLEGILFVTIQLREL